MASLTLEAPSAKSARITVPGDKSITHRALLLAAIASGRTTIVNSNMGRDVFATVGALRALGVSVRRDGGHLIVQGAERLSEPRGAVYCRSSATTMRLLAGLLAGRASAVLDGDRSLRMRPMSRLVRPLSVLGARIRTHDGKPPLRVEAVDRLAGACVVLDVPSAQVKSAVILAALQARSPSTLVLAAPPSRDHTERMLARFGVRLIKRGQALKVKPAKLVSPGRLCVPGDFSAAFFFLCAAALVPGSHLRLAGVGINATRTAGLRVLEKMGASVSVSRRHWRDGELHADLSVRGGARLNAVRIPTQLVPNLVDEIPALCALAAAASGTFVIHGATELRNKESDRIHATAALVRSFGASAHERADGLVVKGARQLRAPRRVSSFGDHRIAMAAAVLGAAAGSTVTIDDAGCIADSFPGFAASWRAAFGPS